MEQDQSMEVIIHRLAREALQNRRAGVKESDRELLDELETLSTEIKVLLEQLPEDKKICWKCILKSCSYCQSVMEIICIFREQKTAWNYSES